MECLVLFILILVTRKMFLAKFHLLVALLLIEVLRLTVAFQLSSMLTSGSMPTQRLILNFTLMVCEARVGLGLLIKFVRKSGSELMQT